MRITPLTLLLAPVVLIGTLTCKTATTATGGASGVSSVSLAGGAGQCGGLVPVPAAERRSSGHPLLPPKWAFGVLWGSYYDQTGEYAKSMGVAPPLPVTLQDAAAKIRDEYAGDLMWIDSTWLYHVYGSKEAGANYLCFKFDPTTGAFLGTINRADGTPLQFDGLWDMLPLGSGVYFTAGIADEEHGLFGLITED